jgi:hypothetical protein
MQDELSSKASEQLMTTLILGIDLGVILGAGILDDNLHHKVFHVQTSEMCSVMIDNN